MHKGLALEGADGPGLENCESHDGKDWEGFGVQGMAIVWMMVVVVLMFEVDGGGTGDDVDDASNGMYHNTLHLLC